MATETAASPQPEPIETEHEPTTGIESVPTENDKPTVEQPPKKRPKLDLTVKNDRKRGKSMFGLLVGTLNKAKLEDKQRNATDAAKKRQLIDQRLQAKIARETESVRRAEETKRDRQGANRKEEELALKDSIQRNRFERLAYLANFLSTADDIHAADETSEPEMEQDGDDDTPRTPKPKVDPLKLPPRSHPPHVYFLPAKLLPSQHAFIEKRKASVKEAIEKEKEQWYTERKQAIEEIVSLRAKVDEEEGRLRTEKEKDEDMAEVRTEQDQEERMDVEEEDEVDNAKVMESTSLKENGDEKEQAKKEKEKEPSPTPVSKSQAMDEDDAVEY